MDTNYLNLKFKIKLILLLLTKKYPENFKIFFLNYPGIVFSLNYSPKIQKKCKTAKGIV